jgi:hypothetical protein
MTQYGVAYMDVGQGREQDAASFAVLVKGITINYGLRLVLDHLGRL